MLARKLRNNLPHRLRLQLWLLDAGSLNESIVEVKREQRVRHLPEVRLQNRSDTANVVELVRVT